MKYIACTSSTTFRLRSICPIHTVEIYSPFREKINSVFCLYELNCPHLDNANPDTSPSALYIDNALFTNQEHYLVSLQVTRKQINDFGNSWVSQKKSHGCIPEPPGGSPDLCKGKTALKKAAKDRCAILNNSDGMY